MTLDIRPALQPWGVEALQVYMVTDRALTTGRPLDEVVRAAVAGGAGCVQLREKHLSTRDFVAQARALRPLLAACHVPLVINDRIDVALACGADGVHLGQDDMPAEVRDWISGNYCRCTGYHAIVDAICDVLRQRKEAAL